MDLRIGPILREFVANVRLADLLDVVVVSICIYVASRWISWRGARPVVSGVALVILLYVVATRLDMYLTSILFQAGLTAVLVALVLVFQDDVRRLFERLAAWNPVRSLRASRREIESAWDEVADRIVRAATELADRKIGALVVIHGREGLVRLVRGGVPLDGEVTIPLLLNIFQPNSPGHDGAVLVERGRVARFATHLPLSSNHAALGDRGTRHAAGLGIAERSDALAVIVSEETGSISVAERGTLAELASPTDLRDRVLGHLRTIDVSRTRRPAGHLLLNNVKAKVASVLVATILWLLFAYQPEVVQRAFGVPIEYRNLPPRLVLAEGAPSQAELTLSGRERVFDLLNPTNLAISLDLGGVSPGPAEIRIGAEHVLNRPGGLDLRAVDPGVVRLQIRSAEPAAPAAPDGP